MSREHQSFPLSQRKLCNREIEEGESSWEQRTTTQGQLPREQQEEGEVEREVILCEGGGVASSRHHSSKLIMGEEFHTGVCSGDWWNPTRGGFDRPPPLSSAAAVCCSAAVGDVGSFRWTMEMSEIKARSGEESAASVSGSMVVFHGSPTAHASDSMASDGFLMEPTLPVASSVLSSPSMDWNQVFIRSSRRAEGDFHAFLHDQLSSRAYISQETSMGSDQLVHMGTANSGNPFRGFNQEFMADKPHLSPGDSSGGGDRESDAFHGDFLACSPTLLQGPLHQDVQPQNSYFNTSSTHLMSPEGFCLSSDKSPRFPQFLKASPPRQQLASSGHHQFSDDTHFWNAMGTGDRSGSNFRSTTQMNDQVFTQQAFEEKPNLNTTTRKPSSEAARDSGSATAMAATATKKSVSEPAFKRPRIETPSPLPTFKVRKEKLGDRITALQQLVSPFGKTDTASVLHEAIEYIKFLHEQVGALSGPCLKSGSPMQCQQNSDKSKDDDGPKQQDLKSRGLCLVPISFTFPVVNEPEITDFWTHNFGGTYIR